MSSRADKFRQAAVTLCRSGDRRHCLNIDSWDSPQRGAPPLVGLLIGAIFVAIFGVVIYSYAWVTKEWARRVIAILTGIFVVTNTLRMLQYLINFIGLSPGTTFRTSYR